MWPEVTGRLFCKRLHDAEDWCVGLPEVPTRTLRALWLMLEHGALDVRYIELAHVSAIDVSDGGIYNGEILSGAILGGVIITPGDAAVINRGGLHIRLEILKYFAANA